WHPHWGGHSRPPECADPAELVETPASPPGSPAATLAHPASGPACSGANNGRAPAPPTSAGPSDCHDRPHRPARPSTAPHATATRQPGRHGFPVAIAPRGYPPGPHPAVGSESARPAGIG